MLNGVLVLFQFRCSCCLLFLAVLFPFLEGQVK